jgi:hypothetical protein
MEVKDEWVLDKSKDTGQSRDENQKKSARTPWKNILPE